MNSMNVIEMPLDPIDRAAADGRRSARLGKDQQPPRRYRSSDELLAWQQAYLRARDEMREIRRAA